MDKPTPIPKLTKVPKLPKKKRFEDLAQKEMNHMFLSDSQKLVLAFQEVTKRCMHLERQLAIMQQGGYDRLCRCGHARGAHEDLPRPGGTAHGPCLGQVIVGNSSEPMGDRRYHPCGCAGFTVIAQVVQH